MEQWLVLPQVHYDRLMTALQKLLDPYRDAAKTEREKGTYFVKS